MRGWLTIPMLLVMMCIAGIAEASPAQVWQQAMQMAANGHDRQAVAHLSGAAAVLSERESLWKERMQVGAALLDMRERQAVSAPVLDLPAASGWVETRLIKQYQSTHAAPEHQSSAVPALLAAVLPGAGHAWQGRWRDAAVTAMLVWPMLALTLWAARRRMGPVTVFFALLTVWLWSGTVFSAVSLAERGDLEAYLQWWQGLWQASALPGRPW